jgi:hypothetical protein
MVAGLTRGKHAGAQNSHLREQLKEATDARRRLEQRLHDAEVELRELRAWKSDTKANGLPEVRAERKRNDDLNLRLTVRIDELEREGQEQRDEIVGIFAGSWRERGDNGEPRFSTADYERLADLCTPRAVDDYFAAFGVGRQNRRDGARMPRWAVAHLDRKG